MESENILDMKTLEETLASMNGISVEKYRKNRDMNEYLSRESQKYIQTPSSEWPKIEFNWDLSEEGQRYSLDGENPNEFKEHYPDGFLLGCTSLLELDNRLCHYSRRDDGELWKVGCQSKLASLIVYLSEGNPISPPLVKPLETGEVILCGGHHRYAIAKEIGEIRIPIHIVPKYKSELDALLNVNWKNA